MKGHKHSEDEGITLRNVKDKLQARFRYANGIRSQLKEARSTKPVDDKAAMNHVERIRMLSAIYDISLDTLMRTEDVIRAVFKPRHYAALKEQACNSNASTLNSSSTPIEKSSKVRWAS